MENRNYFLHKPKCKNTKYIMSVKNIFILKEETKILFPYSWKVQILLIL